MAEGEFALVRDHLEAARNKPALGIGDIVNDTELYFMLVDMAVLQRDETTLHQYAALAEEMALRDGHTLYQASAHRAFGVMHRLQGDYAAAETRLNQALELFQGLETRWQIGRTLFELAEVAVGRTDLVEARSYFSRALAAFEEIGAVPDMARTQAALGSLG